MRTRPDDLSDSDLIEHLLLGWGLRIVRVEYVPVGGGSHHWLAHDAAAKRHWVTVDELDDKAYLGDTRADAFNALRRAFDTALALRQAGLEFVVAPLPSSRGASVEQMAARHALAVFPFLDGTSRPFEADVPPDERAEIVDMLVRLHGATTAVADVARPWRLAVPSRRMLEDALVNLDHPWTDGPFSEPARDAIATHATTIRRLLATFDGLTVELAAIGLPLVITHGEPHPGNFVRTRADGRLFMVDWDTAALGPPERDLWVVGTDAGGELARYAERSGRRVNHSAIRLYRLRWLLDDTALFVDDLRSAHNETADTAHAWRALTLSLALLKRVESAPE